MSADEIKFRCSSLGHIMTDNRSGKEMGETAKVHLVDVFVSNKYNRFTDISAKQLDKGNEVEEDSITVVSRITGTVFSKNEEHIHNEYIKGTPDLFQGADIRNADVVRDTKSSWDAYSFFRAKNKGISQMNYWQITGYMALTGAKVGFIDYCLNNTPYHLVTAEIRKESYKHEDGNTPTWIDLQIIANHVYDEKSFHEYMARYGAMADDENSLAIVKAFTEIPLKERHFCFEVKRDEEEIKKLYKRVLECRAYMNKELFETDLVFSL